MLHQFHNTSDRSAAFRTLLNEQECRGYGRNFHSSRPHIIEIHFCRRPSLLLAAASETEAADWLTAVAQSELAGQEALPTRTAAQHPPSACGVIVTDKNIILFQSDRLLASAPLHTVALIMTSPQDYFCIIVTLGDLTGIDSLPYFIINFFFFFVMTRRNSTAGKRWKVPAIGSSTSSRQKATRISCKQPDVPDSPLRRTRALNCAKSTYR